MIRKKMVDRYAHQSGVKDQLVAEREVVLTYALHAMREANVLDLLAFKGGTCLRKIIFGSTGRFSEDLDFTLRGDDEQVALTAIYEVLNGNHGVVFELDDWYETDDGFGMEVRYRHDWNSAGKYRLQVSTREKPTLEVTNYSMVEQVYFKDLEFGLFDVPCLNTIEVASEKIRAAFQRAKVRDFYDLHLLTRQKLDGDLLRALVVLKLWQVRDAFDGATFFEKLKSSDYDWADLKRLLRPNDRVEPATIIEGVEFHFQALHDQTDLERDVVADARKGARNGPLAERLREEIRRLGR
ncbi:MAG TPA: nucleotidyl transferase AbiEii/AbiGii toxin family protein [Polyangiaceae bacterium]